MIRVEIIREIQLGDRVYYPGEAVDLPDEYGWFACDTGCANPLPVALDVHSVTTELNDANAGD